MVPPFLLRSSAGALLALCSLASANAAPVAAARDAAATAAVLHPLEIIKREDLDFGYVAAPAGGGTVVIDPETNLATTTGGALLLGGSPHAALFTGSAKSSSVVIIRIPKQAVTLS